MNALDVYLGSNGDTTVKYYKQLSERGPVGLLAMNLFRAMKCSDRAKQYTRGSWKRDAYDRKQYSMEQLIKILQEHGQALGIRWGIKKDPKILFGVPGQAQPSTVLYVDLPNGQVSFHSPVHYAGLPEYPDEWDGQTGASRQRVILFCDNVFGKSD